MINLLLAVACSVAIGMIFKHTGPMGIDRPALLTVNYAAAVGVAGVLIGSGIRSPEAGIGFSGQIVGLGVAVGALLITGFFLLSYATDVAGMSLAIGVMRVSVVIPFLASWIVWEEIPSGAQLGGMGMAGVAFFLIAQKHRRPEPMESAGRSAPPQEPPEGSLFSSVDWHAFIVLALTFVVGGSVDVSMKLFEEHFASRNSHVLFLLLSFGGAFVIGTVIVGMRAVFRDRWPSAAVLKWGLVLGIVNYGSLEFLLRAIAELPGPFVFPANNIAIMLLSAGFGVSLWDEYLSPANRIGIGLAVVALVLLRL